MVLRDAIKVTREVRGRLEKLKAILELDSPNQVLLTLLPDVDSPQDLALALIHEGVEMLLRLGYGGARRMKDVEEEERVVMYVERAAAMLEDLRKHLRQARSEAVRGRYFMDLYRVVEAAVKCPHRKKLCRWEVTAWIAASARLYREGKCFECIDSFAKKIREAL